MDRKTTLPITVILTLVLITGTFALPNLNNAFTADAAVKKVKVTYYKNGGTFTAKKYAKKKSVVKMIKKNKKLGTTPGIKRTGYTFIGWYNKKSGGKKYTKNTKIKKATKLYARWAKQYTVSFIPTEGVISVPKPMTVTYGKAYGKLPEPTVKAGYTFLYWTIPSTTDMIEASDIYTFKKNITLEAHVAAPQPNVGNGTD